MPANDYSYLNNYSAYNLGPKGHFLNMDLFNFIRFMKDRFFSNIYIALRSSIEFQVPQIAIDNDLVYSKDNLSDEAISEEFEKYFNSIIQICKVFKIKLILGTQFYNEEFLNDKSDVYFEKTRLINQVVRNLAKSEDIEFLDLENIIPKNNKYMYDAGHLNETGVEMASTKISELICKNEIQ